MNMGRMKAPSEAPDCGYAAQLGQSESPYSSERDHCGCEQAVGSRLAEVCHPVVVGPGQRVGNVWVLHEDGTPRRTRWDRRRPGRFPWRPCRGALPAAPRHPSLTGWRTSGSSSPTESQVIPGFQMAWRGILGLPLSRKTWPLILRYESNCPSSRQRACLPRARYSGSRYFSQTSREAPQRVSRCRRPRSPCWSSSCSVSNEVSRLPARHRRLRLECFPDFVFIRPPVRAVDLGYPLSDYFPGRFDVVEPTGVLSQESWPGR